MVKQQDQLSFSSGKNDPVGILKWTKKELNNKKTDSSSQ